MIMHSEYLKNNTSSRICVSLNRGNLANTKIRKLLNFVSYLIFNFLLPTCAKPALNWLFKMYKLTKNIENWTINFHSFFIQKKNVIQQIKINLTDFDYYLTWFVICRAIGGEERDFLSRAHPRTATQKLEGCVWAFLAWDCLGLPVSLYSFVLAAASSGCRHTLKSCWVTWKSQTQYEGKFSFLFK